jgi:transketolase
MDTYKVLREKAKLIRKWCLISTTEAGSGHPTSCLSAADLGTTLFEKYFKYDLDNPLNPHNDRFVLSKGHAAPLFYALYGMAGAYPIEELRTLRKFSSRLEGHPTPHFLYTDAATGSLGQGLSIGAGLSYMAKNERLDFKTYVMLGDGELAEGQVWEACNFASYYKLNNLIAIADINRLGQSQETMFGHHIDAYKARFEGFGFHAITIDGHDFAEIDNAFSQATKNTSDKPVVIIAKTHKGHGISFLQDKDGWHGKPLPKADLEMALEELGEIDDTLRFDLHKPQAESLPAKPTLEDIVVRYERGQEVATREVYGEALARLGDIFDNIYALDAEVKNSTFSQDFKKVHPSRFVECFIAEQNMVGIAIGIQRLGRIPFVSTFASFLSRAFDQIRMARLSDANIKFVGSHSGISIGEDGASQMGLEDIAMFGVLPDTVILHPSDAVSTIKLLPHLVVHQGISYLRTLRPKTPILYDKSEHFEIGGSKILKKSDADLLTVVAAGITVHEAIKAADVLAKEKISIRVVDCYSIKPIDKKTLEKCLGETKRKIIVTVEDHFEHGGLGDFVLDALRDTGARVNKLSVKHVSRSGSKSELLHDAKIDAAAIVETVKRLTA